MKGPLPGFSRGVNDALITASTLVHFKAAGLLGFALTLSGIVVSGKPGAGPAAALHYGGILTLIASACCSGAAIFPKKVTRRGGLIFWGDIALHPSADGYVRELERLGTAEEVDREYAFTNHRLSVVLDFKYGIIRWAITLLLAGAAFSGLGRILQ